MYCSFQSPTFSQQTVRELAGETFVMPVFSLNFKKMMKAKRLYMCCTTLILTKQTVRTCSRASTT